jgi:hypothetical protein
MGLGRFISFLGALALFGPSAALAQGSVTGITIEPIPAATCTFEKITILGTGSCSSISVDLGDGTNINDLPGTFPLYFFHAYKNAGTFPLTAQGQGTCSGTSTINLSVAGPTVTSVFPFSVIKPLGGVILQGQHFGSLPGQFLINLTGASGNISQPLEGVQWGDTFVAGSIPMITGVLKQTATFTIVTQCGASTTWDATFTPLNDEALIPWQRIPCSISIGFGVSDSCQTMGGHNFPFECNPAGPPFLTLPSSSIDYQGWHASGWGGGSSGYDQFWPSPSLKNDWVFDSWYIYWDNFGGGSYVNASMNSSNPATPVVGVDWHADACGLAAYDGSIYINGPSGVPY